MIVVQTPLLRGYLPRAQAAFPWEEAVEDEPSFDDCGEDEDAAGLPRQSLCLGHAVVERLHCGVDLKVDLRYGRVWRLSTARYSCL